MDIRPIRTNDDLTAAFVRIDALWGAEPGTPEEDELEILAVLVEDYENRHFPTREWTGSDDDVPDLSASEWQETLATTKVQRGWPKAEAPKVSTTIRLSPGVLEHFRAGGPGWQTRIDEILRKAAGIGS